MFSMTILLGEGTPWTLLFKTQESFDTAKLIYNTPALTDFQGKTFELTDDFGQHAFIKRASIHGVLFEDLEQSKLANVERGLHHARTQIAAEQAGRADPVISGFRPARPQGPAVLSPMGPQFNGPFRQ